MKTFFLLLIVTCLPLLCWGNKGQGMLNVGISSLPERKGQLTPVLGTQNLLISPKSQIEVGIEYYFNAWLGLALKGYYVRSQNGKVTTASVPYIVSQWESQWSRNMLFAGITLWWRFSKNWGINYQTGLIKGTGKYEYKDVLDYTNKIEDDFELTGRAWELSLSYHFNRQGLRAGIRQTRENMRGLDKLYLTEDSVTYSSLFLNYFIAI